ncbi:MAG: hypothetical protein AMS16_05125 [Planctomycetes bacterium DG_58]|nr:MAG: hypothetical protein AMS16_05125 [Planctomycetes bacterium DG_58]
MPRAPCAIEKIRLSAPNPARGAVVPNVTRPKGFQVWNSSVLATDFDLDFGDPAETLRPIRIVGTLGGTFSGKVVVGSDAEIKGLRAAVSELRATVGRGRIPPSAVTIRYARPHGTDFAANFRYLASAHRLEALDEVAPDVVGVRVKEPVLVRYWTGSGKNRRRVTKSMSLTSPGVKPVFGAVCPVWVTVNIPADAAPGEYTGTLTITADGEKAVQVPVTLTVCGWTLPEPKDWHTFVDLIQSPETLAMAYEVPMWSDEHFRLIERSLEFLGRAGKKTVYIRMICETNLGNAETMVRWTRKPDGTHAHDLSAFERYMDLVEKHMGKPPVVCLYIWDKFLERMASRGQWESKQQKAALGALEGMGPEVTAVDPVSGRTSKLQLPPYADPKAKALWKPASEGIRRSMKRRGMPDSLMLGIMCDYLPSERTFQDLAEIYPGVPWVSQAHNPPHKKVARHVGYTSTVFYRVAPYRDPSLQRLYGWKEPQLRATFWRRTRDDWPITTFRFMGEMTLAVGERGFARIGGDFFPVLKDKEGRVVGRIPARYVKSYWNNLNITMNLLAPGEHGPVATSRFEMMREGLQECEARIFIEHALTDETRRAKLGEELAKRCRDVLDERIRFIRRGISTYVASGHYQDWAMYGASWWTAPGVFGSHWYISSGWETRSRRLFDAAYEVAKRLGHE